MLLYDRFLEAENFQQAWQEVSAASNCPGVDGETAAQFAARAPQYLEHLRRSLRAGTYIPMPLRQVFIPKAKGWRELGIPTLRDRTEFQLATAKALVWGKLMNSKQLLLRLNRKRSLPEVAKAIAGITQDIDTLEQIATLDALRGYEGAAAARYFPALGHLLVNPGFSFQTRNRRPPKDPVNSLLSFGYTLLFNNMLSLILAEGLNPYIGNLHRSERKQPELVLDLMEEFRSPIVDSLVVTLVNRKTLKPTDFTWHQAEGGVYLEEPARRVFLKAFEQHLNQAVSHPDVQQQVTYRRAMHLQVQRYKATLLHDTAYEPYLRTV